MNKSEYRTALFTVWLAISAVLAAAVAAPFVLPAETLAKTAPRCEAKARGGSCVLCGATTGFLAIAEGDFGAAQRANAGSVPLFCGFGLNTLAATAVIFRRISRCRV